MFLFRKCENRLLRETIAINLLTSGRYIRSFPGNGSPLNRFEPLLGILYQRHSLLLVVVGVRMEVRFKAASACPPKLIRNSKCAAEERSRGWHSGVDGGLLCGTYVFRLLIPVEIAPCKNIFIL